MQGKTKLEACPTTQKGHVTIVRRVIDYILLMMPTQVLKPILNHDEKECRIVRLRAIFALLIAATHPIKMRQEENTRGYFGATL